MSMPPPPPSAPPLVLPMSARAMIPEGFVQTAAERFEQLSKERELNLSEHIARGPSATIIGQHLSDEMQFACQDVACEESSLMLKPAAEESDELANWYEEADGQISQSVMFADMAAEDDGEVEAFEDDGTYEAAFDFLDVIMEAAEDDKEGTSKNTSASEAEAIATAGKATATAGEDPAVTTEVQTAPQGSTASCTVERLNDQGHLLSWQHVSQKRAGKAGEEKSEAGSSGIDREVAACESEVVEQRPPKDAKLKLSNSKSKGKSKNKLQALRLKAAETAARRAAAYPMLPNWETCTDNNDRTYFCNHLTRETSWTHPAETVLQELLVHTSNSAVCKAPKAQRAMLAQRQLEEVHRRAMKDLQFWDGPHYLSEGSLPYYYNLQRKVSVWWDPAECWEAELQLRRVLLWILLRLGNPIEGTMGAPDVFEHDATKHNIAKELALPKRGRRARKQGSHRQQQSPLADAPPADSDSDSMEPTKGLVTGEETRAAGESKSASRGAFLQVARCVFCKCLGFSVRKCGL
eukprot:TRINITY_DN35246_c0_g1_i1.p1 TRINITY_DN35246_c0_g1~~TRINITY_DN35246_c0_g1_i1.p1  ORF type:complete len:534 (+),score=118.25 TRINITY_DN35246_c0_g1_i1:39-1604(+)